MRVAAMGDTALTDTPGGACRPSCHVREATTRLAQLYAPAPAGRHPEPGGHTQDAVPGRRPP